MGNLLGILRAYALEFSILLIFALLYLINIGSSGLGLPEEIYFIQSAREMLETGQWGLPFFNQVEFLKKPPMFIWMVLASFKMFGVSLWAARIPAVLMSLGSLVCAYSISLTLFNSRVIALLSAAILATCWGFFRVSHVATADVAFTAVLLLASLLFVQWHQMATRPKANRAEITFFSGALGAVLGVALLTKGSPGVLFPLIIFGAYLFLSQTVERLQSFDWKPFVLLLALIGLPWPLWVSTQPGHGGFLVDYLINIPLDRFRGVGEWGDSNKSWLLYFKTLLVDMLPWTLFAGAAIVERLLENGASRKSQQAQQTGTLFLLLWFAVGFISYTFAGYKVHTALIPFLPPIMLLVGRYLGQIFEDGRQTKSYQFATDGTILLIMSMAVVSTIALFQMLPDAYPGSLWTMPGPTMITEIDLGKTVVLPDPFPVWKLWLLPGPFILLLGGSILYTLGVLERPQYVSVALVAISTVSLLFVSALVMPVLSRPVGEKFSEVINNRVKPQDDIIIYNHDAQLSKVLFFLKYRPKKPVMIFDDPLKLEAFLRKNRYRHSIFGIMGEDDYYAMDDQYRQLMRVLESEWKWRSPRFTKLMGGIGDEQVDFKRMTDQILLFETLPWLSEIE